MKQVEKTCKTLLFLVFLSSSLSSMAQNIVKGTVTESTTGEPLTGVTVRALVQNTAVITGIDGNYTIQVGENDRLQFSYVGFDEAIVSVDKKSVVNVALVPQTNDLEEIVVIGYGTQRKMDLTGSVGVVDVEEAKKTAATNIYEMLQGQVPGVSVSTTSQPGSMSSVLIRGLGSFNTVGPLYVLDGLIVNDVNHLNPNEIESMQVLKDASAAAIYGARGANGVVIITTKHGKKGKPTLDITATFSVADMPKTIKMKSTTEFMYYNEQAYTNANTDWPAADYSVENTGKYIPDTDWQKAVFKTGFTQDYNLLYTQGSDNVNFALGAGYMDQTAVMEGPKYQRFTARFNGDATHGILKLGVNSTFQHAVVNETNSGSFLNALSMPSVIPVYDPDEPSGKGGYGYGSTAFPTYSSNPVAIQDSYEGLSVDNRAIANVYLELKPIKGLTYKLNAGVDAWFGRDKYINHCYTMRMASGETRYEDVLTDDRDQRITTVIENTLTYETTIAKKHHITALVGHSAEDVNWHWIQNEGYNQQVEGLWEIDLVETQNDMEGSEQERRQLSYIGRIDYNYNDLYLFQFNFRSDGSSKFGPDNRRGNFPSFSAGWRISEEKFWEPMRNVVDNLKLRFSWGKVGDMQTLGNYSYIPSIDHDGPYEGFYAIFGTSGSETIHYGATQSSKVNVDLGWETKTTTNVGLDFNLFHSRLFGTFDWFYAKSTDLLLDVPQAWATGVETIWTNYGEMRNTGIEFTLGWHDRIGKLDYSVSANIATNRNKVLKMADSYVQEDYTRTEVGHSMSEFYLLKADGIFQSMDEVYEYTTVVDGVVTVIQPDAEPGDVRYVDVNGDGTIDDNDKTWCGSSLPKFELGFNMSLAYKDFDFNMFWSGKFGNKIYNEVRANLLNFSVDNIPADVDPWTWDNPSSVYPRMYASSTDNNKSSDRFLENGSYFRLKNVQLGYTLPASLCKSLYIQKLRVYISGTNLITITGYKGYDPDIIGSSVFTQGVDWGQYPSVRQLNFGVQLTF